MQTHPIESYLEGVWYDRKAGDYCEVHRTEEGNVALTAPHEDGIYHEWSDHMEALDEMDTHFEKVPDDAVSDPAEFIDEILDLVQSGELPNHSGQIGLGYARQHM